jgi:hypothetical protein
MEEFVSLNIKWDCNGRIRSPPSLKIVGKNLKGGTEGKNFDNLELGPYGEREILLMIDLYQ